MQDELIARGLIQCAKQIVVLTGAGISVASGVPINRVNHSSTSFLTTVTTEEFGWDPEGVWSQHLNLRKELRETKPNAAHVALAELFRRKPHALLTQNIDGLHEASGHGKVLPVHGTLWANQCVGCGWTHEDRAVYYERIPTCALCGDVERPRITWVGDALDQDLMSFVFLALRLCDLLIVVGTSATVMPVAYWPFAVAKRGIPIVEVNPCPLGVIPASLQLRGRAEEVLPMICAQ